MFKEENLGKFYIEDRTINIVVGYNYLTNKYIVEDVSTKLVLTFFKNAILKEVEETNFIDYKDYPKYIENSIKKDVLSEKIIQIYNENKPKDKNKIYEYERVFNKISETYINIESIERMLKYKISKEQREFYEKELKQVKKGLRKNKKIIYRYLGSIKGNFILDYLEKNNYPKISVIIEENKRILEQKNELLTLYEEIIKKYQDFIEKESLPKIKE